MPSPRAISCHLPRSFALAWSKRGYHAKGTEILRPSVSSTVKVSSVTATAVARGVVVSVTEVVIPGLQQLPPVLIDEAGDVAKLCPPKTAAAGEPYWIEPELGDARIPLDMNVRGLVTVSRIEEKPIRPHSENGRHRLAWI